MTHTRLPIYFCLLLVIVCTQFGSSLAKPATALNNLDEDYYRLSGKPLPSGYYYVDNGYISAVQQDKQTAKRRKDSVAITVQFTPLIKYKHTHTKKKKLFVPNFFG